MSSRATSLAIRRQPVHESRFPGFPPEAITFLRGLERHNKREWFQPRKHIYEEHVRGPLETLVNAINGELAEFAPRYVTPVKKAVFRIYRDTRFSKDKRPYKTHVAATFYLQNLDKAAGPCFYFHFTAKELLVFAGVWMPERDELLAIRNLLAERHEEFRAILSGKALRNAMGELKGEQLLRVPKGFAKDHPAEDLIRRKQWFLENTLDGDVTTSGRMLPEIINRFRAATPMLEFLIQPFVQERKPKKLPFMAF
ncbi:MAG TPA: DUF2461 domain-containing protein [Terriglobales bacterium]|jgi:uncharacterized protein (TIGR02453 family)|nr:DUF2461 domain-containing protein [Terriglobales bacterium]